MQMHRLATGAGLQRRTGSVRLYWASGFQVLLTVVEASWPVEDTVSVSQIITRPVLKERLRAFSPGGLLPEGSCLEA